MNSKFTNTVSRRTFFQCGAGAALATNSGSRIAGADGMRTAPGDVHLIGDKNTTLAGTVMPLVDKLRLQAGGAKP